MLIVRDPRGSWHIGGYCIYRSSMKIIKISNTLYCLVELSTFPNIGITYFKKNKYWYGFLSLFLICPATIDRPCKEKPKTNYPNSEVFLYYTLWILSGTDRMTIIDLNSLMENTPWLISKWLPIEKYHNYKHITTTILYIRSFNNADSENVKALVLWRFCLSLLFTQHIYSVFQYKNIIFLFHFTSGELTIKPSEYLFKMFILYLHSHRHSVQNKIYYTN